MGRSPKPPKKELAVPPSTYAAPSREALMEDVKGAIVQAVEARAGYVRQEATTITLASVRRILEKDLNVDGGFLEAYKEIVAELIKEILTGPEEPSPETQETGKGVDEHTKGKEPEAEVETEEKMDDIPEQKPKMKRLKKKVAIEAVKEEEEVSLQVANAAEDGLPQSPPEVKRDIEAMISEAAHKRASYFKFQAETLTIKGVRRLLEQDMEFENGALDAYKNHIRAVLDDILNSKNPDTPESPEDEEPVTTGTVTKAKKRKATPSESTKKPGKKRKSASVEEIEKSDIIDGERTPKVRKGASQKTKKKVVQEEDEDGDGTEESNEKGRSSAEEADDDRTERKNVSKSKPVESKPVYGRKVEQLKSVIKDCGITVPPSVYKKAKQAGEAGREGIMIKELEAILQKEGLTGSASKEEIKSVRKRKEKLKDLEGIDTSNIIEESRGRRSRSSANTFFAPQRNTPIDLDDEDKDEDEDGDEDESSDGDPNVESQDDDDDED